MRRRFLASVLCGVLLTGGGLSAQGGPFSAQIEQFWALIAAGGRLFTNLGIAAGGYITFGTTRGANGYGIRDNPASPGTMQFKNSGGGWSSFPSAGDAPADAKYILQQPNATLTNGQALSALASGFVLNTTGTGVLSSWAGGTCANSFFRAISAAGSVTCAATPTTAGAADWGSALLPWANYYFSGASGTPATNNFELTGTSTSGTRVITAPDANTSLPIFGQFATFTGMTAARSYALPDAAATIFSNQNFPVTACTNQFFRSIAATGVPTCATVSLTADVSGITPAANGGTGQAITNLIEPPRWIASTLFETAGRFSQTLVSAGTNTFDSSGVTQTTTATISSSAVVDWFAGFSDSASLIVFPEEFDVYLSPTQIGTDVQTFWGIGAPTTDGSGITYTFRHIGFKLVRSASGTINLSATQADGTTETASVLTTVAAADSLGLSMRMIATNSVTYYFSKNGAAWSAGTNLTTNVPTNNTGTGTVRFAVTDAATATQSTVVIKHASLVR